MNGPQHAVEPPRTQDCRRLVGIPVRLAKLNTGQDAQILEPGPALLDRLEVPGDVEAVLALVNHHEVGMLRKGNPRQSELQSPLAAALHRAAGGVPRPFGVHVEVRRQGHRTRLPGVRNSTSFG